MSTNVVNQMPYLRTSREFPEEVIQLTVEVNKSYIDTANAINNRTIAIFPTSKPAINGESWFINNNQKQQALRQVYTFTTLAAIDHNITNVVPAQFVRGFGTYTDGTNSYGLIYGSNVAIAGQISFYITPTQIIFLAGAGAPAVDPDFVNTIVLEWLSQT